MSCFRLHEGLILVMAISDKDRLTGYIKVSSNLTVVPGELSTSYYHCF